MGRYLRMWWHERRTGHREVSLCVVEGAWESHDDLSLWYTPVYFCAWPNVMRCTKCGKRFD